MRLELYVIFDPDTSLDTRRQFLLSCTWAGYSRLETARESRDQNVKGAPVPFPPSPAWFTVPGTSICGTLRKFIWPNLAQLAALLPLTPQLAPFFSAASSPSPIYMARNGERSLQSSNLCARCRTAKPLSALFSSAFRWPDGTAPRTKYMYTLL
jgi:hypothetical protein